MKRRLLKSKKIYLSIIALIAVAGSLFFFPMNIEGRYTCFYHRIFDHSDQISGSHGTDHHQEGISSIDDTGNPAIYNETSKKDVTETPHHGSELLDNYLHQYAFPWWASIGLLAVCIYLLLRMKKNVSGNRSNIMVKQ